MVSNLDDLPERVGRRLSTSKARPGRAGLSPSMSYGRHNGPPRCDAREAAVLLLIYPRDGEWHVPLTRRQFHLAQHPGQVSLPGGSLEPGESSSSAALREADEELGVTASDTILLGTLSTLYLFNTNFYVTPWVAATRQTLAFRPNPAEVAELIELPLNALLGSDIEGTTVIRRGSLEFSAPCVNWRGTPIWGATHVILGQFSRLLRE